MSNTPNLEMPLLALGQAQKETTHNQALVILDAIHGGVVSRTETTPPAATGSGVAYIVPSGASGVWSGHTDEIAYDFGSVWNFIEPTAAKGLPLYVNDDEEYVKWDGAAYIVVAFGGAVDAASTTYTPFDSGDWGSPTPDDVAQALDALAAFASSTGNAFGTIVVSGQSDVVADTSSDTLTLVQGSGITITTNAGTDTVTIAASGTGGTELKGLTFTSDTGSTADSDPGNGLFKWNNATQASATVLFFDNQTLDSISLTTFYGALPATGFLYLQQSDDATKWQLWKWTAVTSGSGYYKFTVTLMASGGSIADDKTVYVDFKPDGNTAGASTTQTGEMMSGFIGTVADKSYKIVVKAAHGGTITETTTISASGTCTATFKINTTALGGTANSVSSSEQSQAHASSNAFSAGDDIVITISSNSSCLDMSFTIQYTRVYS